MVASTASVRGSSCVDVVPLVQDREENREIDGGHRDELRSVPNALRYAQGRNGHSADRIIAYRAARIRLSPGAVVLQPPVNRLPSISAFFPAYNEEHNVAGMVERLRAVLPRVADEYEIIIVDDGSADRTGAIADELAAQDPHVRVVHHPANRGYGGALKSGFAASRNEYVFFTDGDGQFDVEEIERLLPFVPDYDIVVGYRMERAEGGLRQLNASAWNRLVRLLFRVPVARRRLRVQALQAPRLRDDPSRGRGRDDQHRDPGAHGARWLSRHRGRRASLAARRTASRRARTRW